MWSDRVFSHLFSTPICLRTRPTAPDQDYSPGAFDKLIVTARQPQHLMMVSWFLRIEQLYEQEIIIQSSVIQSLQHCLVLYVLISSTAQDVVLQSSQPELFSQPDLS